MFINTIKNCIGLAAIAITAFSSATTKAATVYTSNVASGNWSTAGNWTRTGSGTPVKYKVAAGHAITLDVNVSNVDTVWVSGTLNMGNNRTLTVNANGTVILDWGATIQGGSNNTSFIMIGSSYMVTGPFTSNNIITSGPRWLTASSATAALGAPQASFTSLLTLLPVSLSSIAVEKTGADFQLSWTALGQSNQNTFTIEVSEDGKNFNTIGQVAGNSELAQADYSFNLGNKKGSFYVRLSETDINGIKSALAVKYVKNNNITGNGFEMFPTLLNSADMNVNMVIPTAGNYQVVVYSMDMKTISSNSATTNSDNEVISLNGNNMNLNSGNYMVVVSGNNEVFKSRILVK